MTDERLALFDLIDQRAEGNLVREMLAFAAERLMALEVNAATGTAAARVARRCRKPPTRKTPA